MEDDRLQTAFKALTELMTRLRAECPWDRKQTHASLRRYLLEESHEVIDALDGGDDQEICGELGDLLFQVWFHAELASERPRDEGGFDLADVLERITEKLTRRHPHVFGDVVANDPETVRKNWEQLKLGEGRKSVIDGVPGSLPALASALVRQEKAAAVGFDWSNPDDVGAKIREETEELSVEIMKKKFEAEAGEIADPHDPNKALRHEFGDVLFSLVNYGRHLGINAEDSLREANTRFEARFRRVEQLASEHGRSLNDMDLTEMDALWDEAKLEED